MAHTRNTPFRFRDPETGVVRNVARRTGIRLRAGEYRSIGFRYGKDLKDQLDEFRKKRKLSITRLVEAALLPLLQKPYPRPPSGREQRYLERAKKGGQEYVNAFSLPKPLVDAVEDYCWFYSLKKTHTLVLFVRRLIGVKQRVINLPAAETENLYVYY